MKALGLGWRGLAFRDIEIGRDERGKPLIAFHGNALARARSLEVLSAEVTITHGRDIAAAVVALLTRPARPRGRPCAKLAPRMSDAPDYKSR